MLILVLADLPAAQRARLAAGAAPDEVHFGDEDLSATADRQALDRAEVVFGSCPPALLPGATALRWLQLDSVGCDQYLTLDWDRLGRRVTVTNLRGFFSAAVAETGIGGLLAVLRGVDELAAARASRTWVSAPLRPRLRTLSGARALLAGFGSIGRALQERLAPFGCDITTYGTKRSGAGLVTTGALDRQLRSSDVVFLALPGTPATSGLIGPRRLAAMGPDAVLVNLGRGTVVDEAALVAALHDGRLGGAVLDVTAREPLPPGDPLWTAPRTVLTQHTAGGSRAETDGKVGLFLANLDRYRADQPLDGAVNWARGY
ncbi:MAG: D-2-hydroxyacid dehydrogenase [Streptosporangiaceae bacterium]